MGCVDYRKMTTGFVFSGIGFGDWETGGQFMCAVGDRRTTTATGNGNRAGCPTIRRRHGGHRPPLQEGKFRAKAGIDLMNFFLYKCGGEWGIPASDEVLPRIYIVRDLADSTGSASKIHSV